jgi:proteasome accessory factor C
MSESALDRTARALDLVPYLLEHQGISIPELAEAFGVSEKQINDDLVLIHMCGLPGYTPLELIDMFYEDGYVTVSDPQSFKKPRSMNKIEMTSLLVSLDLLKSLRTDDVAKEIEALKLKLQENMRFENPFVVVQNMENTEMVEAIERAIAKSTLLRIDYASGTKDKTSVRDILPIEIYVANGSTYLNAWCQSSKGDRTFRLDRILNYEMIEGSVINQTRETNVEALDSSPIELLVSKSARNFIEDNRVIIGRVEVIEDGEQLLIELNPIDREWLVRTILGFGGQIEVSKPKELALEVVSRAREIKESYRS